MKDMKKHTKLMNRVYNDLESIGGISSIKKLYDEVKKINGEVNIDDVKNFLKTKPAYTQNKIQPNRFFRRKFMFPFPGHTICADVAYLNPYVENNCPYILVLMDGYSRYVTCFPLKSLKSSEIVPILDEFFEKSIYRYSKIFTDCGVEFLNNSVKKIYKKHNVKWYTTYSKQIKVSIVERFIKTLKRKFTHYVVNFNDENFLKDLNVMVKTYNLTPHRSLLWKTPMDVFLTDDWEKIKAFSQSIYKSHYQKMRIVRDQLSIGEVVRIKNVKHTFKRAYHLENSIELFKVDKVNLEHVPITYNLKDLDGEPIIGIFYRQELVKAEDPGIYRIEIIRQRMRNKKSEFLVKYVDFPSSAPQWVDGKSLKKIKPSLKSK